MKKLISNSVYCIIAFILVLGILYIGLHHSNMFKMTFNILGVLMILIAFIMIVKRYSGSGIGLLLMSMFILILNNLNIEFTPIDIIFSLIILCTITYLLTILEAKFDKKNNL